MENSKSQNREQVSLFNLVFTHNWEDPCCDHAALQISPGDVMLAITSGGCNAIGFLLFDPRLIYCVDINPAQSHLLELKLAAIRRLEYDEFIVFMGLKAGNNRLRLYDRVKQDLSAEALRYWNGNGRIISQGLQMNGKYERFIRLAGKFINLLQGSKRVRGLLTEKTKEEQEIYFDSVWNTRRFRYLFKILFNKWVLARRGLVSDYFQFDDGSKSFADSFYNRSKKAFRNIPVKGNYFLSLYLTGKYRNLDEVPAYLKEENFQILKARIDRIKIITSDAQSFLDSVPDKTIDCFALSNICELMSEQETLRLFTAVALKATPDARVIFRNLMIPREVPDRLTGTIIRDDVLSTRIYNSDRSFVYGKVAAYRVARQAVARQRGVKVLL